MQVFHSKQLTMPFEDEPKDFPAEFIKVADVVATSLDEAYQLTNSIDKPWVNNESVTPVGTTGFRSTSCGDVIEKDGKYYMCEMIGWKEITPSAPVY
jgi:hypothetical protein